MIKHRIAILLLVGMLMFVVFVNIRQARVIELQRIEIRNLFQTLIGGSHHG